MGGEIAGLALAATSPRAFRAEVLRKLIHWAGADSGFIHKHFPSTAPLATGTFEEMDMHYAGRCVAGWDEQYGKELAPVIRTGLQSGGFQLDAQSLERHSSMSFYSDIIKPSRALDAMFCAVELGGEMLALCVINRSSRPLSERALALIRGLLPVFTLGDRVLSKRDAKLDGELPIARLTQRERQVTELITLGYTNPEIAMALGSSRHTVRNQVASIFRKAGASTRAELVGIVRG
jgi:DNA-binding CsgD family transcriptional regulator